MRAGRLRHRVAFEQPRDVRSAAGSHRADFVRKFETWAEINILGGAEKVQVQQVQAEATTRIRIRWRSGIDATWRIVDLSQADVVYDIVAVLPDYTGRRELNLACILRTSEGTRRGE